MEDDQQFCLRWNNHQSTLIQNFDTLLESGTLVDCTLAAEGKYLKAHKVVLSACSPYFEGLLSEHYDKHPVFILKDVKFKELKAMMDYMYRGEVNISQDQLAALLKAAESLQIKGLSESKSSGGGGAGGGGGGSGSGSSCNSKTEQRQLQQLQQQQQQQQQQQKVPSSSQSIAQSSLDIPHSSSGLTIEKNVKVPRQSLSQTSVDIPEDSASPQISRGLSSREGSLSPTSLRKRKKLRRRSIGEDNSIENHEASNSSDISHSMSVPALGIAPVADEKVHADPTDSLGRSALMQQLTKPADEMLQMPIEKPEPNDNLIEPKSEYLEDPEESVEDLTLDDDMNDLNEMEQDNPRAGPSHDPNQHPGLAAWHVTGDRSNAGGVVGAVGGTPGTTDEVFLAAQEAAQAHRDSQDFQLLGGHQDIYGEISTDLMLIESNSFPTSYQHYPENELERTIIPQDNLHSTLNTGSNSLGSCSVQDSRYNPGKRFFCPKCGRGYKYLADMRKHYRFQCGQDPRFKCPYCPKKCKSSSNMYSHVRVIHKNERLYILDFYKRSKKKDEYQNSECHYSFSERQ